MGTLLVRMRVYFLMITSHYLYEIDIYEILINFKITKSTQIHDFSMKLQDNQVPSETT